VTFDRNQEILIGAVSNAIAKAYDWSSVARVVDIGGGTGTLLSGILATNPHLSGVIFEREVVAANARASIAERGLGTRCQVVAATSFGGFLRLKRTSRFCRTSSTTGTTSTP
jgi:hypothetical protein